MVEIVFWIISVYVCYQLNKELHRDIFENEKDMGVLHDARNNDDV